jgi:hypothetical protein
LRLRFVDATEADVPSIAALQNAVAGALTARFGSRHWSNLTSERATQRSGFCVRARPRVVATTCAPAHAWLQRSQRYRRRVDRMTRRITLAIPALACVAAAACAHPSAPASSPDAGAAARQSPVTEGIYAICGGAYAHSESLTLRDGRFDHFIQTHGINGGRSTGTYAMIDDTLVMTVTDTGPAPAGVLRTLTLDHDFVVGELGGYAVLWRGRQRARADMDADTGRVSPYAALFHGGSDPGAPTIPACNEIRLDAAAGAGTP